VQKALTREKRKGRAKSLRRTKRKAVQSMYGTRKPMSLIKVRKLLDSIAGMRKKSVKAGLEAAE
jgi:hypothetical protein